MTSLTTRSKTNPQDKYYSHYFWDYTFCGGSTRANINYKKRKTTKSFEKLYNTLNFTTVSPKICLFHYIAVV